MPALQLLSTLAVEFAVIFLFILIPGYLIPCGQAYYTYFMRQKAANEERRIQERRPNRKGIRREIRLSLLTITIFSVMGTALFEMYKAGWTSIYRDLDAYPLIYLPISFFICLVVHDTFFYWTHRFMHWRPVFKYFHAGHHKSVSPSPWATYAFQPLEAITQFCGIMLIVLLVPLHPIALLAFLSWDTIVNVAGHTGYELVPNWLSRQPWFKGFNTVTHHDNHHTNMKVNYGAFFNVWDRWMGTYLDDRPVPAQTSVKHASRRPAGGAHRLSPHRSASNGLPPHRAGNRAVNAIREQR